MKRLLIMAASLLFTGTTDAQYGRRVYDHADMFLMGARTTNNTAGYIFAACNPLATGSQFDFVINKTDLDGQYTGASEFTREFNIKADEFCDSPSDMIPHHGCNGIDIAEANPGLSESYVVTGTFELGLFWFMLNSSGSKTGVGWYWLTPDPDARTFHPVVRSSSANNEYYMCGTLGGKSYMIKMNSNTGQVWHVTVDNMFFEPYDIIESPVNADEVIVVGKCQYDALLAFEAFFLKLDANNGNLISFTTYSDGTGGDEYFTSIESAMSTASGGAGYILGGRVDSQNPALSGYYPWMAKLDYSGNVLWSSLISSNSIEITDVVERYNGVTSPYPYEYYGVGFTPGSANEISVWKLDDNGTETTYNPDVFIYQHNAFLSGNTDITIPQIEIVGDGTSTPPDGVVTWATDYDSFGSTNRIALNKSYFNGVNGCENTGDMSTLTGPGIDDYPNISITNGPLPCDIFDTPSAATGVPEVNGCLSWGTYLLGNNSRNSSFVDVIEIESEVPTISIYPNPAQGPAKVRITSAENSELEIAIVNTSGKIVSYTKNPSKNAEVIEIDFDTLSLPEGLYNVRVTTNGLTRTVKILHNQ